MLSEHTLRRRRERLITRLSAVMFKRSPQTLDYENLTTQPPLCRSLGQKTRFIAKHNDFAIAAAREIVDHLPANPAWMLGQKSFDFLKNLQYMASPTLSELKKFGNHNVWIEKLDGAIEAYVGSGVAKDGIWTRLGAYSGGIRAALDGYLKTGAWMGRMANSAQAKNTQALHLRTVQPPQHGRNTMKNIGCIDMTRQWRYYKELPHGYRVPWRGVNSISP